MGIKFLNKYLIKKCSKRSIRRVNLSDLKNKVFVIDTSIYLYKFYYKINSKIKCTCTHCVYFVLFSGTIVMYLI